MFISRIKFFFNFFKKNLDPNPNSYKSWGGKRKRRGAEEEDDEEEGEDFVEEEDIDDQDEVWSRPNSLNIVRIAIY